MANIKFLLQEPYKSRNENSNRGKLPAEDTQERVRSIKKKLNPLPTRLYCFLIVDRKHMIKIKTEHTILPKEWDFKKQGKKEMLAGAVEFNKGLMGLKADIINHYDKIRREHPDMPFIDISAMMKEYGRTKSYPLLLEKGFFDALDEYVEVLKGQVTDGTLKKYRTLKKSLIDFGNRNKKYKNITFRMIDPSFRDSYSDYLRNREPRGRQKRRPEGKQAGLLVDTTGKYIETLKTFCRWAEGRGYNKYKEYQKIQNITHAEKKRLKPDNDIITLTLQELNQFYNHDFSEDPRLERVRDLFCFAAFTGQRWSDILQFREEQVHGDIWSFKAHKTKKETEIDLIGYAAPALSIAKKYNYNLPFLSLQKFNDFLKEAGQAAKIDTPVKMVRYVGVKEIVLEGPKYTFLSSHTARKTCVSILLNVYNLPITHVLEITGHSDLKTLQKYIDKDRASRRKALLDTRSITQSMTVAHSNAV